MNGNEISIPVAHRLSDGDPSSFFRGPWQSEDNKQQERQRKSQSEKMEDPCPNSIKTGDLLEQPVSTPKQSGPLEKEFRDLIEAYANLAYVAMGPSYRCSETLNCRDTSRWAEASFVCSWVSK